MRPLVVDANVIVGALLGRSLPLVMHIAAATDLIMPVPMILEAKINVARKAGRDAAGRVDELLQIIAPLELFAFAHCESEARARLHAAGQSDWPVLAAALAFDADIWSRDVDFFGTGVAVWSTYNVRRLLSVSTEHEPGAANA